MAGSGRESYEVSPQNPNQNSMSNMRFSFSGGDWAAATYSQVPPPAPAASSYNNTNTNSIVSTAGGGDNSVSGGGGQVFKRKRGRPRKYAPPDATNNNTSSSTTAAALTSPSSSPLQAPASAGFLSPTSTGVGALSSGKKSRGRPPGSTNKHHHHNHHQVAASASASGSAGVGFTPHVITVKAGEDVLAKLMSFSQNDTRALCILSANGAISNVTLRQAATSGGTVTYEGRFEILSLSGSFLLSECAGQHSRTGGLSVSLAGPDGCVLGGGVAGLLTAASPVQIIVGSFVAAGQKEPKSGQAEVQIASTKLVSGTSAGGSLSESSGGPGSPLNQSNNSNPQGMASMPWR